MKILVIVVSYNAEKWLKSCFSSIPGLNNKDNKIELLDQCQGLDFVNIDTILVDNASSDNTLAYVKEHYPSVKIVEVGENLGFGKANNIAMQYALDHDYDYVYLLNQDAWLCPGCLEELVSAQLKYKIGILSPMQYAADGLTLDFQFEKRLRKNLKGDYDSFVQKLASNNFEAKSVASRGVNSEVESSGAIGGLEHVSEPIYLPYIMASHWLISRKVLETVGLFSPSFPHYGEDENYCHRTLYHNFSIAVLPGAKAIHDRAQRKESKQVKLHRNYYMKSLVRLSKIGQGNSLLFAIFMVILEGCYNILKYKSFLPLNYLYKIFCDRKEILANRHISLSQGAFVKD